MTLDEAIQHAEEVAKECEEHICRHPDQLAYTEKFYDAEECAREHRQLAEWLKDYKNMKARERGCDECKYLEEDNGMCWECDENCSNWESE